MPTKGKATIIPTMRFRGAPRALAALVTAGLLLSVLGGGALAVEAPTGAGTEARSSSKSVSTEDAKVAIYYLEIVSNDVDALCAAYERVHGLSFGPEDPDLGQARVAVRADGSRVGIRRPLAEHEQPGTTRTYLEVADIERAVRQAEEGGAIIAYPPTRHGELGTFAIFIQGDVQHGLWQR